MYFPSNQCPDIDIDTDALYTQSASKLVHSNLPGSLSFYYWPLSHHRARSPCHAPARDTMDHPVPYPWHASNPCPLAHASPAPQTDLPPIQHLLAQFLFLKSSVQMATPLLSLPESHLPSRTPKAFCLPPCLIAALLLSLITLCLTCSHVCP